MAAKRVDCFLKCAGRHGYLWSVAAAATSVAGGCLSESIGYRGASGAAGKTDCDPGTLE
ncbi:hypothetical protein HF320_04765 [Collinsella sp. KGMB02528]|uniref:Lipoprotein n=1 Tax=Collinsella acetigenes TaxID=2713419 RepID=A0A7X9YI95_9ACTN|nr:hypothetical protein [Collinsella acetigenes]NMF55639.1 hypothetical protein [Collinsella acetigenes]